MNPKISIIVPVYNTEKYLNQCIESLMNQTFHSFEILIINDGSQDGSLELIRKYANIDSRIKCFSQKNLGVSKARNKGLIMASGEYVFFVDSDDWIELNTLEILYATAIKYESESVMCTYVREFENISKVSHIFNGNLIVNDRIEIVKKFHRRLIGPLNDEMSRPELVDILVSPCMQLFKKKSIENYNFIDTKEIGTAEDLLFQINVYNKINKVVYIDQPLYHYRKTNTQSITSVHKSNLFEKWEMLFSLLEQYIDNNITGTEFEGEYKKALHNRIALSMIGIGLNEIAAKNKSIFKISKRLKYILKSNRYKLAYEQLDFKYFPIQWKIFYYLCKNNMTLTLVALLYIMDFLRKR